MNEYKTYFDGLEDDGSVDANGDVTTPEAAEDEGQDQAAEEAPATAEEEASDNATVGSPSV